MTELREHLPAGWESKIDVVSGRTYFINHKTKTTTWDDPWVRQRISSTPKHMSNTEQIPLQHGSPDLRRNYVYPSQTPPIQAFQMFSSNSHTKSNPLQEFRNASRSSPLLLRGSKVQDSSLTTVTVINSDQDQAVSKISAMFPTVSETHIRFLMKKYHNREALVISALQVEKNPITTPGPFATPPPQRNIHHPNIVHMTPPLGLRTSSRGGSPVFKCGSGMAEGTFRSSPRPQSSPKMKLSCRYMKSIFPKADETVILEILYNNENNIQKSSEILIEMGFQKKDTTLITQQKTDSKIEGKSNSEDVIREETPQLAPHVKTAEEKTALQEQLKAKYKDVADHLVTIALESVDYNENKANQILQIIVQENSNENVTNAQSQIENKTQETTLEPSSTLNLPVSVSRQSIKSLLKSEKNDSEKTTHLINTDGSNFRLAQGPNSKYLLEDYVKWQGPNTNFRKGPQELQKGPNRSLLGTKSYQAQGSNPELAKGPKFGLARGSIFSQLKNVTFGESRGK